MNPFRTPLLAASALACCASLQAAPVIYEPFAQTAGSISGKAGGTGLGSWAVVGTASTVATTPTLAYGQLPNSAGQLTLPNGTGQTAYVATTSALANAGLLADGATLWFSFTYSKAAGGGANERSGFAFGTDNLITSGTAGAFMSNSGNGVGVYTADKTIIPITWNGGGNGVTATGTSFTNFNDTVTVVGRIVWGATSGSVETLTIWSPDETALPLNVAGLGAGFSKTMAGVDQTAFDTISMQQRNSGGAIIFDEIRFGASYQDVIASSAASTYWDRNSATAGAGTTPDGDWDGATSNWNTDPTGGSSGTISTWPAGGVAIFSAGSDASATYTATVTGTQSLAGLIVKSGSPTISGGTALDVPTTGSAFEVRPGLSAIIATPIIQSTSGTANFSKENGGTLTLSGNNTYPCPTAVNGGNLILSGDNSGSTSAVTVNGGVIQFNATNSIPSSGRTVTVNAGNGAALFGNLSNTDIAAGLLRIVAASAGTIAADNNATGNFDLSTAGLTTASFGAVGSVNYTGTLTPNGTVYRLGGGGGTLTLPNASQLSGARTLTVQGPGSVAISNSNNLSAAGGTTIAIGGTLVVGNSAALNNLKVTFSGTGNLILGSNFSSGGNQIFYNNGAVIKSDSTTARTVTGVLKGNAGHTLILGDATNTGKLTFTSSPLGSSSGFIMQCNSDVEFTNAITIGCDALTKTGSGTMILSGTSSSYTGATNANAGILAGIGANAFGSTSAINLPAVGTLSLRGNSSTSFVKTSNSASYPISTSASGATINADQATVAGTSAKTMTIGALGTTSTAAGYQVNFTGSNSTSLSIGAMTGAISTAVGTVTIANSIASPGTLTLASYTSANTAGGETLVFNNVGTTTVSGAITPSSTALALTKNNATGTLILGGTCGYTGPTAVNAGTVLVNGSTHANSAVTVAANATLGGIGTINGTLSVTAGGILKLGANSATLALANATAPTYNQSGGTTYTTLKLNASAATLDKIAASATTGNSVANVDLVIDTTGLSSSVSSTVIYSAGGAITGPFHSVTFSANPGGYVATVDYSVSGQISLALANSTPVITATGTLPGSLTTTYGVASGSQSVAVSGTGLTAAITATAQSGFQVSSDDSTFGSTATFAQSGGNASGTLYVRLAATAGVTGSYDSVTAAVLSSSGATSVNVATTPSGNSVGKANASVVVSPYSVSYDGLPHTATVTSVTGVNSETGVTVGTVTLSTTHTAPGTYTSDSWSFTGTANYNDISSTAITDTITANSFQSWLATNYPGLTGSNTLPTANPDNDTLTNLQEFAFGTDPTTSSTGPITWTAGSPVGTVNTHGTPVVYEENGHFYAVYGRRVDFSSAGLTYTPQFSVDLTSPWAPTPIGSTPEVIATDNIIEAVRIEFGLIDVGSGPQKARFFEAGVSQ